MILYTSLIPSRFAGLNIGPVILIRPSHKDDNGLHAHEQKHVEQFWRNPLLHGIKYWMDEDYRLACEVEAYREQLKHSPQDAELFASYIAEKYDLGITPEKAMELLNA